MEAVLLDRSCGRMVDGTTVTRTRGLTPCGSRRDCPFYNADEVETAAMHRGTKGPRFRSSARSVFSTSARRGSEQTLSASSRKRRCRYTGEAMQRTCRRRDWPGPASGANTGESSRGMRASTTTSSSLSSPARTRAPCRAKSRSSETRPRKSRKVSNRHRSRLRNRSKAFASRRASSSPSIASSQ